MNAVELIAEVAGTILEPSYDDAAILALLNRGQLACASRMLMPGLADGSGSINTVTDGNTIALPETFHRELFAATVSGDAVRLYDNKAIMLMDVGHEVTRAGDVVACCVSNRSLFYMDRPAAPVAIDLSFYRKPVAMTLSAQSYPDGTQGESEIYDSILISYACWKIFARIEQGLEGGKTDTLYYKNEFEEGCLNLSRSVSEGRPHRKPTVSRVNW